MTTWTECTDSFEFIKFFIIVIDMDLNGLKKVGGYSFEDVVDILDQNKIPHTVRSKPSMSQNFFRDSDIAISEKDYNRLTKYIGNGRVRSFGGHFYYAEYKILPEFDFNQLDGYISFKKGLLIERTAVVPLLNR